MSDAGAAPERRIWTEADFEQMGWHDCAVHALAFRPERFELRLDLDYILEWVAPTEPGGPFTFRVAPATLVFHNVSGVTADLQPGTGVLPTLDALTRADRQPGESAERVPPANPVTHSSCVHIPGPGRVLKASRQVA